MLRSTPSRHALVAAAPRGGARGDSSDDGPRMVPKYVLTAAAPLEAVSGVGRFEVKGGPWSLGARPSPSDEAGDGAI